MNKMGSDFLKGIMKISFREMIESIYNMAFSLFFASIVFLETYTRVLWSNHEEDTSSKGEEQRLNRGRYHIILSELSIKEPMLTKWKAIYWLHLISTISFVTSEKRNDAMLRNPLKPPIYVNSYMLIFACWWFDHCYFSEIIN
jgi:hypothetical protein